MLRNLLQGVLRALLPLEVDAHLSKGYESDRGFAGSLYEAAPCPASLDASVPQGPSHDAIAVPADTDDHDQAIRLVCSHLKEPTGRLLLSVRASLQSCDAVVMDMSGFRRTLGPPEDILSELLTPLAEQRQSMIRFDAAETALLEGEDLSGAESSLPNVVKMLAYSRQMRQVAGAVEVVMVKVNQMQERATRFPAVYLPSYPIWKAMKRNNAQVSHDRGGVTAGTSRGYYCSGLGWSAGLCLGMFC